MIYYKKHQRVYAEKTSTVVAMCDEALIGKKIKSKATAAVLDLVTYANFYKGELLTPTQARAIFKTLKEERENLSLNLVGTETLSAAKTVIDVSTAKKIGKIPHLQVYWM